MRDKVGSSHARGSPYVSKGKIRQGESVEIAQRDKAGTEVGCNQVISWMGGCV